MQTHSSNDTDFSIAFLFLKFKHSTEKWFAKTSFNLLTDWQLNKAEYHFLRKRSHIMCVSMTHLIFSE